MTNAIVPGAPDGAGLQFTGPLLLVLEDLVARFNVGQLELWELPTPLDALGWAVLNLRHPHSLHQLEARLLRAERDADFWYERANNPGRNLDAERQRRIDQAVTDAEDRDELRSEGDFLRVVVEAALPPKRAA